MQRECISSSPSIGKTIYVHPHTYGGREELLRTERISKSANFDASFGVWMKWEQECQERVTQTCQRDIGTGWILERGNGDAPTWIFSAEKKAGEDRNCESS